MDGLFFCSIVITSCRIFSTSFGSSSGIFVLLNLSGHGNLVADSFHRPRVAVRFAEMRRRSTVEKMRFFQLATLQQLCTLRGEALLRDTTV